jgi:hypothetical protein
LTRCAIATAIACMALRSSVLGHPVERPIARELVRLAGFGAASPPAQGTAAPAGSSQTTLVVHGTEKPFAIADYRVFGALASQQAGADAAAPPARIVLQGDRAALAAVAKARADQRVTILAERRPGSAELFLLTLDLCPP